ncbi:M protein, serotype 2.1-like [Macrobrachium rosenbergii]|uniref:M protein, serotype 2.1-like n=1 Tax=Macrobrachium rosenbergii TaxID=79674 RepID=UPI0034D7757D
MTEKAKETEVQIKEREKKDQRLIILENTVVVLQMKKETLHRDLQQTENSRREMQVTINKLNEDLEKLRQENGRKQNHIESLNRQNENETLKINDLEDELQVLTTPQKQMAHENSEQFDRCKTEIVEKEEELEKLKEQNLQRDKEILRLQNECTQKQNEVICMLKESKSVVAEKPKANGKVNEMTRRRVQLEFELAEAKEELETMEFEKMETTLELERLQEDTLAKDTKIRSLETKVKILKGRKASEEMKGHNLMRKEKEVCKREKNKIKMVPQEQAILERKAEEKKALYKTRCLRKPNINCKALYQQMDSIKEELRQIRALQRPSTGTKRHSKDPTKIYQIRSP